MGIKACRPAVTVTLIKNMQRGTSVSARVHVERGTGFVNRLKMQGSPYLAEGKKGPYSP